MLINFRFSNFTSYRDEVEFTAIASREKRHRERLFHHEALDIDVLPIAAIWGGNGSGKSNIFWALDFVRRFILGQLAPSAPIDTQPFKLHSEYGEKPSRFEFDILILDEIFRYAFAVGREKVFSESLRLVKGGKPVTIFSRELIDGSYVWKSQGLKALLDDQAEKKFVTFKTRDTLPNRLFLSEMRGKGIRLLEVLADWFQSHLVLVSPNSKFNAIGVKLEDSSFKNYSTDILRRAGAGISAIASETIPFDSLPLLPEAKAELARSLRMFLTPGVELALPIDREQFVFYDDGGLKAKRLLAMHTDEQGREIRFEMSKESEGTNRLIDLMPAFFDLANSTGRVYFIDELDRSLHTLLTRSLIEGYLRTCSKQNRNQLFFTTHDGLLLDQSLLRRDEIWFIDKTPDGNSTIASLADFKVRIDKDIRKGYLAGRFGGVPEI